MLNNCVSSPVPPSPPLAAPTVPKKAAAIKAASPFFGIKGLPSPPSKFPLCDYNKYDILLNGFILATCEQIVGDIENNE